MSHTAEYDLHTPEHRQRRGGAHQVRTPAHQHLSKAAVAILALIFAVMAAVGVVGAYGTYANMKAAFNASGTALGVVAAGEGATAVLGLTLIGLTLISRPYPLALRLGLWVIPLAGSATGISVADDARHAVVYAVTPLAMTCAAELAGYLARSIVVHRTGVDAEADRRTGETLRRIEFHQARAQRHPDERTRLRSERAAWRLARSLGKDDPRLGASLPAAYADRTADTALNALDALYGRTPADTAHQVEPPHQSVEAPAAAEVLPEPVNIPVAEQQIAVSAPAWVPAPAAPVEQLAPVEQPTQSQPAAYEWPVQPTLVPVEEEVHTPLTEVHTTSDQDEDDAEGADPVDDEMTAHRRRQVILAAAAEGLSQREIARRADCSPSWVRKVISEAAA
ncbi:hypothetical protein F7Q99_39390 [Streptomyces kaniharaensis]|uniref:DUF2637 domain-containing protein n=1 Tax=Streptomyces kaniharaensis TaxID=212423 RepID=A0A6N7L457_9ACTN|nr:helix-turn-helix domain-containing protein [Streptomyces kaniharaensis]MQS18095.1 hypothetical protein [Streptomyces kaniharaensis]